MTLLEVEDILFHLKKAVQSSEKPCFLPLKPHVLPHGFLNDPAKFCKNVFLWGFSHPFREGEKWRRGKGWFGRNNGASCPESENESFKKTRGGKAVRSMNPGAGHLTNGIETANRGSPPGIAEHTSAGEMRSRNHRNGFPGDVEASSSEFLEDFGEGGADFFGPKGAEIKENVGGSFFLHGLEDRPGNDIPGGEIPQGMEVLKEWFPLPVKKNGTFSSNRFRDEEGIGFARAIKERGMELDVLHVH